MKALVKTSGVLMVLFLVLLLIAGCTGTYQNPLQVALLRWYDANQVTTSFAVDKSPQCVVWDRVDIWVTNAASNTVKKFKTSDGSTVLLGESVMGQFYEVQVGNYPIGIAYDGHFPWVANYGDNTISKILGEIAVSYNVGGIGPVGVAFDGANIWVTNSGSNTVSKSSPSNGSILGTYTVGNEPVGIAFDGEYIWVANSGSDTVTKLDAADGSLAGTYKVGANPQGIAFDGEYIWVANRGDNTVTKLKASDGSTIGTYSTGNMGTSSYAPGCIAYDGMYIWVANTDDDTVTKLRASNGDLIGTYKVESGPMGIAFDGANIWVTNNESNTISKL